MRRRLLEKPSVKYAGITFAAQRHVEWAKFFTEHKIAWNYREHEITVAQNKFYVPDFWLPNLMLFFVVSPRVPDRKDQDIAVNVARNTGFDVCVAWGNFSDYEYLVFHSKRYGVICHCWNVRWQIDEDRAYLRASDRISPNIEPAVELNVVKPNIVEPSVAAKKRTAWGKVR